MMERQWGGDRIMTMQGMNSHDLEGYRRLGKVEEWRGHIVGFYPTRW